MITVRYRKLASGKYSVYLDCFNETTKERRYEFLKRYVTWDYSQRESIIADDEATMNYVRSQVETRNEQVLSNKTEAGGNEIITLLNFVESLHKENIAIQTKKLHRYLKQYLQPKKDIPLTQIDEAWIKRFTDYCKENYSQSSTTTLHHQLHLIIKKAIENGLTVNGLSVNGKNIVTKTVDGLQALTVSHIPMQVPDSLTDEEIKLLEDSVTVPNVCVKDAFLFSLYTGLRWQDVKELTWGKIQVTVNGKTVCRLTLSHLKSEEPYTIELNAKAVAILFRYSSDKNRLSTNKKEAFVFEKLPNKANTFTKLRLWGYQAGLNRDLCFSMARDSFLMQSVLQNKSVSTICEELGIHSKDRVRFITKNHKQHDNTTI